MKLPFESWLEEQKIMTQAKSCFNESFICYKAGAYKAALLFAYSGFLMILKDRILISNPPTGFEEGRWRKEIQEK